MACRGGKINVRSCAYILVAIALIVCLVHLTITIQKQVVRLMRQRNHQNVEFRCERYLASDQ